MPAVTLISKLVDSSGTKLIVVHSQSMVSGRYALAGYTLSDWSYNGVLITATIAPAVAQGVSLAGLLTVAFAPTSTTGDTVSPWANGASPAGDVTNLSTYGGVATLPCYLDVPSANAIASGLLGLPAWAAASDADKLRALQTASMRVDHSRPWQGRKYNLDEDGEVIEQELEFPRVDGTRPIAVDPNDPTSLVPVVPAAIQQAVVHEANSILDGTRAAAVAARHDGLTAQSIGSASESYRPATGIDGVPMLCVEADMLCRRYQLRTGRLL